MKKRWFWLLIVPVLFLIVGCQKQAQSQHNHKIQIVTSIPAYSEMAQGVLGNKGAATSLIKTPSQNPHDFEPTVRDAEQVTDANFVIYNGLGYDSWMPKLLSSTGSKAGTTNIGSDVLHLHVGANPHAWYNQRTMPKASNRLTAQLSKKYPKNKSYFERNNAKYKQSLVPVQTQIKQIKTKSNHKQVAVSEPVMNYELEDMGYKLVDNHFSQAVENGSDPSPSDIAEMQSLIRHHKIAFFVENTQTDSNIIKNIVKTARKNHVPVVQVTETQPTNLNYVQWMEQQNNQIMKIEGLKK